MKNYFPESSVLIMIGLLIGLGFYFLTDMRPTTLKPDIFFLFLLPPIIGEAGYFMPNRWDRQGSSSLLQISPSADFSSTSSGQSC